VKKRKGEKEERRKVGREKGRKGERRVGEEKGLRKHRTIKV